MVKITIEFRADDRERKSVTTVRPNAELDAEFLAAFWERLENPKKAKKKKAKKKKK